jgi:hypothetical protein
LYAALAVVGLVVLVGAILAMSTGSDGDDDADAVVTLVTTDDTPTSSEDTSTSGEPSSPPETTQPPDTLAALQELEFGQTLATADEQHVLEVDANGQLVLWSEGTERWRAPDDSQPGAVAVMQEDGNFVLYRSRAEIGLPNSALYASGTNGHEGDGAALSVVEDGGLGFVVIRTSSGAELWRRPTETPQPPDTAPPTSSAPSSSSTPSSTSPTPASLTLESASVTGDGDNPTAHFVVSNSGGQPGEIDGVRLNVIRGFWTRVRTPGPSPSRFDVDVLALSPTEPNDIDIAWEPIEPSSTSGPQERTLTFGRSSGGSEPEFAWTVDCTATLLVDGQPVAGTDVALTVVVNPPAP